MTTEPSEREEAPERFWIERRTQHAFTAKPDPYVETVEVGLVADFNTHYEDLMQAALIREENAATRMRERCVGAIRSLRHKSEPDDSRWNVALYHAEKKLESLTLDGEKER